MRWLVLYITTVFVAIMWSTVSLAGGLNRLGGVGPRAGAMSGAYIAVADDVSAFYYNPAGLMQIQDAYAFVGTELIFPRFTYQTPKAFGGFSETSRSGEVHVMPLVAVTYPLMSDRVVIGLGVNVPYGLGASFRERLERGFTATESFLTLTNITPAVAFRLTDGLSLGLGANIGYSQFKFQAPFDQGGTTIGTTESVADGWGLGGTAGLLWKPNGWFSWGLSYSTTTRVRLEGETDFDSGLAGSFTDDFSTHFTFPARLGTGVAFHPMERWIVAFDGNWYDYSGADRMTIRYDHLPQQRQELRWEDNYSLHLGTEYRLGEHWALRGGVGYQTAAIPDSTVSPLTPDVTGWDVSAGIGYRHTHFSIDIGYIYAWGERTVSVSQDHVAPGHYEADAHVMALGLTLHF